MILRSGQETVKKPLTPLSDLVEVCGGVRCRSTVMGCCRVWRLLSMFSGAIPNNREKRLPSYHCIEAYLCINL
jgi:hypothetical protein